MRGHIRRRGRSSWAIVIDIGRDANGKRRQKWHTVRGTKRDAERELARLLNELSTGTYVEPSRIRLSDYLRRWLEDYARQKVSPKTFERYAQLINRNIVPELGGRKLAELRPLHIQAFYSECLTQGRKDGRGGLSPQTVLHLHRVLHRALEHAVRWQLLARNPAAAVEPPKPQRTEMRALNDIETAQLLRSLEGSRLFAPVFIAVTTGLRRGEILALRWCDLDLERGEAEVLQSLEQTSDGLRFKRPKTGRGARSVALPQIAIEFFATLRTKQARERLSLGSLYDDHDLVCPGPEGKPWPPDNLSTAFAAFVRRSELQHLRFHDLRHTHATQLLREGVHPKVVSERLGHSTVAITLDTYSHVLPGMQKDAVARLDMALRSALALGRKIK